MLTPAAIRHAREALKESQAEFGRRFGVSQPTVCGWETKGPPKRGTGRLVIERFVTELQREKADKK